MVNVLGKKEIVEALGNESKELANFFSNNFEEGYYVWFSREMVGYDEDINGIIDTYNLSGSPIYETDKKRYAIQIDGRIGDSKNNNCFTYLDRLKEFEQGNFLILKLKVK